jgi:hypothetical protein
MSRTAMLAALVSVGLFASAGTAAAWIGLNGVSENGFSQNGVKHNGADLNGVTLLAIEIPCDQE